MASAGIKLKSFWLFLIPLGVLLLDQLTKLWAINDLNDAPIQLFSGVRFRLIFNKGTIFGLGGDSGILFTFLGLGAILLVAFLIFQIARYPLERKQKTAYLAGYALLLGGALGNMGDRLFRGGDGFASGAVVDFIDIGRWPVFNVADSAITIGIGIVIWFSIRNLNAAQKQS